MVFNKPLSAQILMFVWEGGYNVILSKEAEMSKMSSTKLVSYYSYQTLWEQSFFRAKKKKGMPLLQYAKFVKPSFEEFILPSKKHADVIIPRGSDNEVAVDLIVQHIRTKLGQHDLCKIYSNVFVIYSTFQVLTILSFVSCSSSNRIA